MRVTQQRRIILEELKKVRTHPTADELYDKVKKRLPKVSLATVYRNLEKLARKGDILQIDVPNGSMRFDGVIEEHNHIRCVSCGRVDDVSVSLKVEAAGEIALIPGYTDVSYNIELLGLCEACSKKMTNKEK